jgi:hypothetical protein
MADPILKAAQRELVKLQAELEVLPAFRRWMLAKAVVDEYEQKSLPTPTGGSTPIKGTPTPATPSVIPQVAAKPGSKAPQIIAEAVKYLREKGHRVNSTRMANDLMDRGIDLPGKSKPGTLSAYLSAAKDEIDNVRGEGYGLREWSKKPASAGVETDAPDSGELSGAPWSNGHHSMAN